MKKIVAVIILIITLFLSGCATYETPAAPDTPAPFFGETEEAPKDDSLEEQEPAPEPLDDELVKVTDYIPDIAVELRYATGDNFTGVVIYEDDTAYLRYGTVKKLVLVQEKLKESGYYLKIWDAYRPVSAQFKLWEVCPDPAFVSDPNKGYSGHSRGDTVDITVVDEKGEELLMPSAFDEFGTTADRDYADVSKEAGQNSAMLENIMEEYGFSGYAKEWWHYSDNDEYPVLEE